MEREALKLALEALETERDIYHEHDEDGAPEYILEAITAIKAALAQPVQEPMKLWLWKNFVDGKPEYWAFDNPFPCVTAGGDPLTLGEPCGWALFKTSVNGRPNSSEQEVVDAVMRLSPLPAQPAQRPWVGLTDAEIHGTPGYNETREMYLFALTLIAKLQEKNNG